MSMPTNIDLAKRLCNHSLETLRQASLSQSADTADGALARGHVFELVGYFDEAAASYSEALTLEPHLEVATARLALAQMKGGHIEKGMLIASALAGSNPNLELQTLASKEAFSAMTILGESLLANGRLVDAQQAYERARTVNPKDSFANGRLAQIHLATGAPKKAFDLDGAFFGTTRFASIAETLAIGNTSPSLLPVLKPMTLAASVIHSMPGRPLTIDGATRMAGPAGDNAEWSALPTLG